MDDLGAKFSRDKGFCFDRIIIQEIIFDDTNDVTLFCLVPYFGEMYTANFGLNFDQLNTILRSINKSDGKAVATALAEKLDGEIEIPSVLDLVEQYGKPLEVNNCILYTTLFDISDDDDEMIDDEDEDENFDPDLGGRFRDGSEEDEDDEEDYEAYAFLIDEIRMKMPLN